ncbi:putative rab-like protein 6 isoform X2 [Iris pallida]|uniref:Rab-like protein 6 isoform X2 n=1 Tax=Iris pallida TaxID=29817 RepID=A0AAX6DFD2_IRIPA|nr:putative rab-like protein 6 isoform X2 [Iris pallida]
MAALQRQHHHRRSDRLLRLLSLPKPGPSPYPPHSSPPVLDDDDDEELDESDIFSSSTASADETFHPSPNPIFQLSSPSARSFPMAVPKARPASSSEKKVLRQSAPVSVPMMMRRIMDDAEEEEEEEEEEGVPPHVMMARRIAMGGSPREIKFSVLEGEGRTLKGRDLRRVRNAVFQKTGFLD